MKKQSTARALTPKQPGCRSQIRTGGDTPRRRGHDVSQALWAFIVLLLINVASDVISSYTGGLIMPYYKHFVGRSDLNDAASFESGMHSTISIIFQGLGASLIVLLHQNYALFSIINAISFLIAGGLLLLQRQAFAQAD